MEIANDKSKGEIELTNKVLVADDEFLIRWSLSEALSKEGYEVKIVEDGNKALETINSEFFDFVITDLMMPGINGWEVLERITAQKTRKQRRKREGPMVISRSPRLSIR
jgi:CheY-like chemotaxis protein